MDANTEPGSVYLIDSTDLASADLADGAVGSNGIRSRRQPWGPEQLCMTRERHGRQGHRHWRSDARRSRI